MLHYYGLVHRFYFLHYQGEQQVHNHNGKLYVQLSSVFLVRNKHSTQSVWINREETCMNVKPIGPSPSLLINKPVRVPCGRPHFSSSTNTAQKNKMLLSVSTVTEMLSIKTALEKLDINYAAVQCVNGFTDPRAC